MVTINKIGGQNSTNQAELYGLSTDEKPVENIPNASTFYEMDTKQIFLFDEQNKRWLEQ